LGFLVLADSGAQSLTAAWVKPASRCRKDAS
jgi:hypothetical protein